VTVCWCALSCMLCPCMPMRDRVHVCLHVSVVQVRLEQSRQKRERDVERARIAAQQRMADAMVARRARIINEMDEAIKTRNYRGECGLHCTSVAAPCDLYCRCGAVCSSRRGCGEGQVLGIRESTRRQRAAGRRARGCARGARQVRASAVASSLPCRPHRIVASL
jgi:hypothetical protein